MICLVRDTGLDRLRPSCAVRAEDGMVMESETEIVHQERRDGLALLLSEHVGDCEGPCQRACPARLNAPRVIRQAGAGRFEKAALTACRGLVLPGVLGRICPAPCEKACRRGRHDAPVSIRLLERLAGDRDRELSRGKPPERIPSSGKRVVVAGGGPAGLAAAYGLLLQGHACELLDASDRLGGGLRAPALEAVLPREVLDGEIARVERLGLVFRPGVTLGKDVSPDELSSHFDAVILAFGAMPPEALERLGLAVSSKGPTFHAETLAMPHDGMFTCGAINGAAGKKMAVRAIAEGLIAAASAGQYLAGQAVVGIPKRFQSVIGRIEPAEMDRFLDGADRGPRKAPTAEPSPGLTSEEAAYEAARCLHCDCRKPESCRLRRFSGDYGADQQTYKGKERKPIEIVRQHERVVYESGKCIRCGLCVRITERAKEPLGLTYIGRGFDVKIGVPFGESMAKTLRTTADQCVAACPTGALAFHDQEEAPTA
jgi:ferredoxin